MGWMFVPLTEYQGGGAAATVEPLHEHLAHYRQMMEGNLLAGCRPATAGLACMTPTKQGPWSRLRLLASKQIARSSRATSTMAPVAVQMAGVFDWILHVNPDLETPGMLVVHNPLDQAVEQTLQLDPYYTGLRGTVLVGGKMGRVECFPWTKAGC